jgi:hypothetical protein
LIEGVGEEERVAGRRSWRGEEGGWIEIIREEGGILCLLLGEGVC